MPSPPPPKKQKITIDDQFTFQYPPFIDASTATPSYDSYLYPGSKVSNSPYSLKIAINISKLPPTPKNRKNMKIDDKVTFYYRRFLHCFPKASTQ